VRSQQCLDDVVSVLLRSEHQGRVAVLRGGRVCVHMAVSVMPPCICAWYGYTAIVVWSRQRGGGAPGSWTHCPRPPAGAA
jgi:hypothetical protein